MKRQARRLTAVLLAAVLAVLALPLSVRVIPAAVEELAGGPDAEVRPPALQRPPAGVLEPGVVSALSDSAPRPAPEVLAPLLDAELQLPGGGGRFTGVVRDAATGAVLYSNGPDQAQSPASNLKLLTAAAVLDTLDPSERLETTVHAAGDGVLYLRGGGDVLLGSGPSETGAVRGHAGLSTLAQETAAALDPASGPYSVAVDDSLFEGPPLNPSWAQGDLDAGELAPVYPLAVNSAWQDEGLQAGARDADPALRAAEAFTAALAAAAAERGISVLGGPVRAAVPDSAEAVASVRSATIAEQVEHMLVLSDNYLAEALARLASAASGGPASSDGATALLAATADRLGVPGSGLRVGDAAGLSVDNSATPAQLAALLHAVAASKQPALAGMPGLLPVAGLSGTLKKRFVPDAAAAGGAGVVRAKTGTLSAVTALSGYVVTAEGRLLSFSLMGSGIEGRTPEARDAVDRAAAVLAACGCR
ncbi:D-alanyl-D-alanine carboxypeptidase/D-alanyl-D-alanine endopeptidase [Arthrobacter zhaoguopingii]|uniref:D-alanyl-D-alanine carboxypeptidase/D-alanyl-D-alanine endopeptidase n=1 Tax=Arthrobacter zhaoguopingii TaxID=2681491 RepID=UPI001FED3DE8|nr:D-alanyl-D-alanine carboxypeptidase/D-alanyl-D-alanine-endopeptidase [Arthrobacter zhaoguopingii]